MIKKISPESSYAIRELSSSLDGPSKDHWRAAMRYIEYLKEHKPYLKLRSTNSFQIIAYCDANYATDPDDRKSISGYIITLRGSIVSWGCKKSQIVSLSSCESEYIENVICAQEIRYVQQMVKELTGETRPAVSFEDNNGAIFITRHNHVGPRTKDTDGQQPHYLTIEKVKGELNPSDILTKNVMEATQVLHITSQRRSDSTCIQVHQGCPRCR